MTSISGGMSPADRMQMMLQKAVSTGTVKSTDQSALSNALGDIDAAMKSSGPPTTGTGPDAMKTRIDGLVDKEVSDGKLTADQATELKQVFAQAAQGMHGHHGGQPPSDGQDGDSDDGTSATASTGASSGSTINQLLAFLDKLKDSTSSTTNYTAGGTSAASSLSSLLVNLSA